jgi:hypothetical protein
MGVLSERLKWTLTKIESGNFSNGGGWISDEQFYFSSTSETPSTVSTTSIPSSNKKIVRRTFFPAQRTCDLPNNFLKIVEQV